jgi:uncharacterized repeat protein (TIGR01451 family)
VSSASINAVQNPAIKLLKTASTDSYSAPGVGITYSYKVTNSGNVTLHTVRVTDPLGGLSTITCPSTTLAPAEFETCTATYVTTQGDVDRGSINNTGTASGLSPANAPVSATSSVTIRATANPGITVVKSADVAQFSQAGTPITYSYLVTNTGNVTLTSVGVADPQPGLVGPTCPLSTLAAGASETCAADYITTQADVDAGRITNVGTASGTPPTGPPLTALSPLTIPATSSPAIALVKSADLSSFAAPNTTVTYNYLVTNTGNVTLNPVVVTDPMPNLSGTNCPVTSLAPNVSETCTATYVTTSTDVDNGTITNTGTATGTPPIGTAVQAISTVILPAVQSPAIGIVKSASVTSFAGPGMPITYSYRVTNSGNVTLHGIKVTDPLPGLSAVHCPLTKLAAGASMTCTADYTTTQDDVDRGSITNTGTAVGIPPAPGAPVSATSTVDIPAVRAPGISLDKTANITSYSAPGTPITYTYTVTNSGNVTLDPVVVTDTFPGLSPLNCPQNTLAPAQIEVCTATYTTTQADVDAGSIVNNGRASGQPPTGAPVTATDSVTIPATLTPGMSLSKSANVSSFTGPGVHVTYTYKVTNTGNVTLDPVSVADPAPGLSAITCPDTALAPAQVENCTATYTTTQADVDAGGVTNTGTATGRPPTGPDLTAQSTLTITATPAPAITLVKRSGPTSFDQAGVVIEYTYVVTNTGNVTLDPVDVTDSHPGLTGPSCPDVSLAPNEQESCTASYTTTQADVDAGQVVNTGTATGTPPTGSPVVASDTLKVPAVLSPAVTIGKTADTPNFDVAGKTITYTYRVTNTGNVTLDPVVVADPMPNLSPVQCPVTSLAPGEVEVCTATYVTTQTDVDTGQLTNVGIVTATPPSGPPVGADSVLTVPAVQGPVIAIIKTANVSSFSTPGTVITYSYEVANAGNVTLDPVTVSDNLPGISGISCPDTSLDVGQTETCTATYATTQDDLNAGSVINTATASGTPPTGPAVTDQDTLNVPADDTPAISVHKSGSPANFTAAGQTITYSYTVTNRGNVTLHNVAVTDPHAGLATISCPATTLDPAISETCTATYVTTAADDATNEITDTGTVTGTSPQNTTVTAQSTALVTLAEIAIAKSASPDSFSTAGQQITYGYLVTNTGGSVLDNVQVADDHVPTVTCPNSSLDPNESETCTGTYTTTQADVDTGSTTNTATDFGTPPSGAEVSATTTLTVLADESPDVTLVKTADPPEFTGAGQVITYDYLVTNTGNVDLGSVKVADPMAGLSPVTCELDTAPPAQPLAPGDSETCTAAYTTTAADVARGEITNTGTVTATPPAGPDVTDTSTTTVPLGALSITKTASITKFSAPGAAITYTYVVTNTGMVPLHTLTVTDPLPGLSPLSCPDAENPFQPADTLTCTATYTTTQGDVDGGKVTNTGTARALTPADVNVNASATVTVPATQQSGVAITKSASISSFSAAGTVVTYSYKVTNTGNVTLTGVTVTDPMNGLSAISCPTATLAPGASETCTATYTTTTADVAAGKITNVGTTTATPPNNLPKVTATSTVVIPGPAPTPPAPPAPPSPVHPDVPVTD